MCADLITNKCVHEDSKMVCLDNFPYRLLNLVTKYVSRSLKSLREEEYMEVEVEFTHILTPHLIVILALLYTTNF